MNKIDQNLLRPTEVDTLLADYSKARRDLNWEPKVSFDELVVNMVEGDLKIVKWSKDSLNPLTLTCYIDFETYFYSN